MEGKKKKCLGYYKICALQIWKQAFLILMFVQNGLKSRVKSEKLESDHVKKIYLMYCCQEKLFEFNGYCNEITTGRVLLPN